MNNNYWVGHLNPEQKEAALHDFGPLLILAGAGSGKTTVLVARTGRLIANSICKPKETLVLTFTNKAAKELKSRVSEKLGKKAKGLLAGTFHSFGVSILKDHFSLFGLPKRFGIIDSNDASAILKDLLKNIKHDTKDYFDLEKIAERISLWRADDKIKANKNLEDPYEEITEILMPKYIEKLQLLGVVDFQDLLLKPIELFRAHPDVLEKYQNNIKQLMIDEFQDTNSLQMKLVDLLAGDKKNISVVGDDDQAIYGWRGADVNNILNFPNNYDECKVIRLHRNYRSTSSILAVANAVIEKNKNRHGKVLQAEGDISHEQKPELFTVETEELEAEAIVDQIKYFSKAGYKFKEMAVLYRSNSQSSLIEAQLRYNNFPYSVTGGTAFFERREVKDILAYLQTVFTSNEVAFRRIINTPSRGIGVQAIKQIEKIMLLYQSDFKKSVSIFANKDRQDEIFSDKLKVETVYQLNSKLNLLKQDLLNENSKKSITEVLRDFIRSIGYIDFIHSSYKDKMTIQSRMQLLELFFQIVESTVQKKGRSIDTYVDFINSMLLRDQIAENLNEKNDNRVQLMTLHACKGLEFPVVFIIGCEEDILPHKTLGSDIDEERRLFYVGLTRAKQKLVLTKVNFRKRYGKVRPSSPSRFLLEIPEETILNYKGSHRPVTVDQKKDLLSDLYKKLEKITDNREEL